MVLQMRWHFHVPVNAFFVAVTLLQNSYVCRAAWPEVPGALPAALPRGWPGFVPPALLVKRTRCGGWACRCCPCALAYHT